MDIESSVRKADILDALINATTADEMAPDEFTAAEYHARLLERGKIEEFQTSRKRLARLAREGQLSKRIAIVDGVRCNVFRMV